MDLYLSSSPAIAPSHSLVIVAGGGRDLLWLPAQIAAVLLARSSGQLVHGLLHGGATATLAETVGSFASYLPVDRETEFTVGVEVTAQHIRSVRTGFVYAKAIPVHLGSILHVWDIRVKDEEDRLIALCKLSVMVRPLKKS